jgi:IclR family transcriptional regulator, pca regulon regulatory protein
MPAHVNAMGRVLLAELAEEQLAAYFKHAQLIRYTKRTVCDEKQLRSILKTVKQQGYALTDEEVYEGRRSIAVAIRSRSGNAIAAMNISAHESRATRKDMLSRFLPLLQNAAAALGRIV